MIGPSRWHTKALGRTNASGGPGDMRSKGDPFESFSRTGTRSNLDFIIRKNRAFSRDEFARRMSLTLLDVPVFVASPEDTIVAKVEWSQQWGGPERQRRDVAGIVATMGEQLN